MQDHPKYWAQPEIRLVLDREEAEEFCEELLDTNDVIAVDSEWYDYDKDRTPVHNGLSLCWTFCYRNPEGDLQLVYMHNFGSSTGNVYALSPFWENSNYIKSCHNIPSDWHILGNHGIKGRGFLYDTMVMDHLLDENRENRHGLKECAGDFLDEDRKDFNQVFGEARLRKDGEPYASGQLIVPNLRDVVAGDSIPSKLIQYACNDAWDGYRLFYLYKYTLAQEPWIKGKTLWDYFCEVDAPITEIICKMERRGMGLDIPLLKEMLEICNGDLEKMEAAALEWAGCPMNINSGKQLAMLLYGHGMQEVRKTPKAKKVLYHIPGRGWPILRRTEGGDPSTKAEHLIELRTQLGKQGLSPEELSGFDQILKFKKYEKQKNTYLVGMVEHSYAGRVHGRINQIGTTSSRFSSSEPNLQNITTGDKDVYHLRDSFVAPPGKLLIVADWQNLEYRLLAHFSQDPTLLELFAKGWDMHSLTAYNVYPSIKAEVNERFGGFSKEAGKWIKEEYDRNERAKSKILNFEIIYGVGHKKLADQLSISENEAKRMIEGWFRGYPYVKAFFNRLLNEYMTEGQTRLLDGRPRHAIMSLLTSQEYWMRGEHERTLINSKIQGSASAICKKAMIRVDADPEIAATGYQMIMQVHDELIGECPIENCDEAIRLMRPHMEQPFSKPLRLDMPVSFGKGPSWASAKS